MYTLTTFGHTITMTNGTDIDDGQTVYANGAIIAESDKTITADGKKLHFSSDVKFIFSDSDKYVVKDGVQEVTSSDIWVVIDVVNDVPYVSAVFVKAAASTTTSADDIVFVYAPSRTANGYSLTDKDGKVQTYDTYDAYIAGEKVSNFYSKDNVATGFYEVEIDNDNGDYKLTCNTYSSANADEGALSISGEETYSALVGNILTGTNDYDISNAVFVDATGTADFSMDVGGIDWGAWQVVYVDLTLLGSGYMLLYPNGNKNGASSQGYVTSSSYKSLAGMVECGGLCRAEFQVFRRGDRPVRTVCTYNCITGRSDYAYSALRTLHLTPYHESYTMAAGSTVTLWGLR